MHMFLMHHLYIETNLLSLSPMHVNGHTYHRVLRKALGVWHSPSSG